MHQHQSHRRRIRARCHARHTEQTVSGWARDVLVATASASPSLEQIVLAEVVALRTIILNLHFALASGETLTTETMQRLIERADQDKVHKATNDSRPHPAGGSYERGVGPLVGCRRVAASQAGLDSGGAAGRADQQRGDRGSIGITRSGRRSNGSTRPHTFGVS